MANILPLLNLYLLSGLAVDCLKRTGHQRRVTINVFSFVEPSYETLSELS